MVCKKIAPYGDWESPITPESVVDTSRSLSSPRVCASSGRAFFIESRSGGGKTIIELTKAGPQDILPADFSVENIVYEYGGSLFDVLPSGKLIFSNKDNTVQLLDPDSGTVSLLIKSPVLRYCGFNASLTSPWVLAIEEDHTYDAPLKIQNYIVAINVTTKEVKRVVKGADFYFMPSFSYDGKKMTWLEWDHPKMLFDDARAYHACFYEDGSVDNITLVSGANGESAAEPRWGPDGSLFFCQETSAYRRLFRIKPGKTAPEEVKLHDLGEAEFGEVRLFEGSRTYAPLSNKSVIMSACANGTCTLIQIDLLTNKWHPIATHEEICHINFDAVSRYDEESVLVIGSGTESRLRVYKVNIHGSSQVIRESSSQILPREHTSLPEHVRIQSTGSPKRQIHGFLWRPRNANFTAPEGTLPPLVISSHGGPTGYSGCGLTLRTQYFTNRGYAYFLLNYTGSTGHGREYRRGLWGNWGVRDTDDAAEVARFMVSSGNVRPGAVGITGLSAGGYNTLQCLSRTDVFAGGFCVSGISDLDRFDRRTHKLEANYTPLLVLPQGTETPDDVRERIYRERSALFHTGGIQAPLLLLHGRADTVVPLEQAQLIADELERMGKDVRIIAVEGEGHMMAKPASARLWLVEEEGWWKRTLLKTGADD